MSSLLQNHRQTRNPERQSEAVERARRRGHLGGSRQRGGALEREKKQCWADYQMTMPCGESETGDLFSIHREELGSGAGPHKDRGMVKAERVTFPFCSQNTILQIERWKHWFCRSLGSFRYVVSSVSILSTCSS